MFDERLIVLGTGIRTVGQLTMETVAWLRRVDRVCHFVCDPVGEQVIREIAGDREEALGGLYAQGKPRLDTYEDMVEQVLGHVRGGEQVAFVIYGHPGVFAIPTHEAVRRARAEGYKARMLPGISAEDCLFADLGVDPATSGCQSFEATSFLTTGCVPDPASHLILWQIAVIGEFNAPTGAHPTDGLFALAACLSQWYGPQHVAYRYEAAVVVGAEPLIEPVPVGALGNLAVSNASTLYVPPARSRPNLQPVPVGSV